MLEVVWGLLTMLLGWLFVFFTTVFFSRESFVNSSFPVAISIIYLCGVIVFSISKILKKIEN